MHFMHYAANRYQRHDSTNQNVAERQIDNKFAWMQIARLLSTMWLWFFSFLLGHFTHKRQLGFQRVEIGLFRI